MTLAVRCPKCKTVHHVSDQMAGQRAKCPCGAIIVVPRARQAAPQRSAASAAGAQAAIVVRCPACGKTHRAAAAMAGTAARCSCGAVIRIPVAPGAVAPAQPPRRSTIWDELNEEQWARIEGRTPPKRVEDEEESQAAAESLYGNSSMTDGLWRDGKRLVCSRNAHFPARCVKSYRSTTNRVRVKLSWCPTWVIILFGALIAMFVTRRMTIEVGMEQRWVTRRWIHASIGGGIAVMGVILIVIGIMAAQAAGARALNTGSAVCLILGGVASLVGLFYGLLAGRALSAVYIDDDREHAWLKGAHPDFLQSLPYWDGPHH